MKCAVCRTEITDEDVSQYAAYAGLPSPCCTICFQVNDFTINSIDELAAKSLLRRANLLTNESNDERQTD